MTKRTAALLMFLGSISGASACSGTHVSETIARNLASGQTGFGILCGLFLVSLAVALRVHRYAFPIGLATLAAVVWMGLGTAYHGDCGSTARDSGIFGAVLGAGGLVSQVVRERLAARKLRIIGS